MYLSISVTYFNRLDGRKKKKRVVCTCAQNLLYQCEVCFKYRHKHLDGCGNSVWASTGPLPPHDVSREWTLKLSFEGGWKNSGPGHTVSWLMNVTGLWFWFLNCDLSRTVSDTCCLPPLLVRVKVAYFTGTFLPYQVLLDNSCLSVCDSILLVNETLCAHPTLLCFFSYNAMSSLAIW